MSTCAFECPHCPRTFTCSGHLNRHIRTHSDERPYVCSHPGCDKTFSRSDNLRRHLLSHRSPSELPFACTKSGCDKRFTTKQRLERHIQQVHSDDPKLYHCSLCTSSFLKKRHLGEHNALHHGKDKPYPCTYADCDAAFLRPSYLQRHIIQVHTEKSYVCMDEQCKDVPKFTKFSDLQRHMRRVHKDRSPNECDDCGQQFRSKNALKRHKKIHDIPVMDRLVYRCTFTNCNAVYTTASNLGIHIRTKHTNSNSFVCDVCEDTFSIKGSLKRHMRLMHSQSEDKDEVSEYVSSDSNDDSSDDSSDDHVPETPRRKTSRVASQPERPHVVNTFSCDDCNATFSAMALLRRHMLLMHSQPEDEPKEERNGDTSNEIERSRAPSQLKKRKHSSVNEEDNDDGGAPQPSFTRTPPRKRCFKGASQQPKYRGSPPPKEDPSPSEEESSPSEEDGEEDDDDDATQPSSTPAPFTEPPLSANVVSSMHLPNGRVICLASDENPGLQSLV